MSRDRRPRAATEEIRGWRQPAPADPHTIGYRVLIVDDDDLVRPVIERALRTAGYATTTVADPIEALHIAEWMGPFDLLITDINMQLMSGRDLANRLVDADPELRVIYFSGCTDLLCDVSLPPTQAVVQKPCTIPNLRATVANLLTGKATP